jgi:hypothetical protein
MAQTGQAGRGAAARAGGGAGCWRSRLALRDHAGRWPGSASTIFPKHGLPDEDFVGYRIASPAEIDAVLCEAVVAIDANVLLDLYRFQPRTSRDLIKTLRSLGDRLVVPHQAFLEFWRQRQHSEDGPGGARRDRADGVAWPRVFEC